MHVPTMSDYFQASYITLGALALLVFVPYLITTCIAWRECGGRIRAVPHFLARGVLWHFVPVARDLMALIRRRPVTVEPPPSPLDCEAGQVLRACISLSLFGLVISGLMFAGVDRSRWPAWLLVSNVLFINACIGSTLGHAYLVYRSKPKLYRLIVIGTIAGIALGSFY